VTDPSRFALVGCGQLLTLKGPPGPRSGRASLNDLSIITDGALLVSKGCLEAVGTRREIEGRMGPDCPVVDAGGRVVMPGFVDAHTHPVFASTRVEEFERRASGASYAEISRAGGGIRATVRLTRAATQEELIHAAKRYSLWFLKCGTTTIEAKSGYGLSVEDEVKILQAIRELGRETPLRWVPTFLGAHEVPDEFRDRRSAYVDLVVEEMLPRVAVERLAEYCDVFCEDGVFTPDEARRILVAARALGLGLRVHAEQLSRSGGAGLAAALQTVTADHLEHALPSDIAALRAASVQPVLLPGSVYALGHDRYPNARLMIDEGLALVLATDFNPGSSPTPSMPMILSLAATQMAMTPAEAIVAATINAAWSLGRGDQVGSLDEGKAADFVIQDCSDYREISYFFGIEHSHAVYVGGRLAFSAASENPQG